jgi:hypothetical protein
MENMMRNMATAAWAVLDLQDDITLVQASRTDAYQVFDKLTERCNSEITKLILGQTGTTDEKAYAGSANVQANVADMIAKQDILNMEYVINLSLIPMMNRLGFGLDGYRAEYDNTETLPLSEQIKIDAELMKQYKLNVNYLQDKYNVTIDGPVDEPDTEVENVAKRLQNLYNV